MSTRCRTPWRSWLLLCAPTSKRPETVESDSARHMGGMVSLALGVRGGRGGGRPDLDTPTIWTPPPGGAAACRRDRRRALRPTRAHTLSYIGEGDRGGGMPSRSRIRAKPGIAVQLYIYIYVYVYIYKIFIYMYISIYIFIYISI